MNDGRLRRRGGWLRAAPRVTALYCSELGASYSSEEIFAINRSKVLPRCSPETVGLYEKLLLRNPTRRRRFVLPYEAVVEAADAALRFERYQKVSTALVVDTVRGLLAEVGLAPEAIDIVVVASMAGKTLPSLPSVIANQFGLRPDVLTYSLGDMGCSAAPAALDLAARLLRGERRPRRALVVALEPVSNLFAHSEAEGAVVGNCLFGEGCAGAIVSSFREPARYYFGPGQRVLKADDAGLNAIRLQPTEHGPVIALDRSIGEVAAHAVEQNLRRLVPRLLTPLQKLRWLVTRKAPVWQRRIQHWALHPGGTAVLDGMRKSLRLAEADLGPSYRVFEERSNMSSPSVLYVLDRIERTGIRKGERVLMLGFGSGFKANSLVLRRGGRALRHAPQRTAVVVGGTSGIGLEVTRWLAANGYRVLASSRRVAGPGAGLPEIAGVEYLPVDVRDSESVKAFGREVWRRTFGLDVLVVSAGVAQSSGIVGRVEPGEIASTVATNLTGAMLVTNELLPRMRRKGKVVLLNSILGQIPVMGSSVYCATKAGLRHFAEALDVELRRQGRGVAVHSVYPAYVRTPMLEQVEANGRTFLAPVDTECVTRAIARILEAPRRRRHSGFVLVRDAAIAWTYRLVPGLFKQVLAGL